jgi:hypothetical protein
LGSVLSAPRPCPLAYLKRPLFAQHRAKTADVTGKQRHINASNSTKYDRSFARYR